MQLNNWGAFSCARRISFEDFLRQFTTLEICHLGPNSFAEFLPNTLPSTPNGGGSGSVSGAGNVASKSPGPATQLAPRSVANLHGHEKLKWDCKLEYGEWRRNVNAGGCRNNISTFATNPQFAVEIVAPDDGFDKGTLIVGLMQLKGRERTSPSKDNKPSARNSDLLSIGYMIYEARYFLFLYSYTI